MLNSFVSPGKNGWGGFAGLPGNPARNGRNAECKFSNDMDALIGWFVYNLQFSTRLFALKQ